MKSCNLPLTLLSVAYIIAPCLSTVRRARVTTKAPANTSRKNLYGFMGSSFFIIGRGSAREGDRNPAALTVPAPCLTLGSAAVSESLSQHCADDICRVSAILYLVSVVADFQK